MSAVPRGSTGNKPDPLPWLAPPHRNSSASRGSQDRQDQEENAFAHAKVMLRLALVVIIVLRIVSDEGFMRIQIGRVDPLPVFLAQRPPWTIIHGDKIPHGACFVNFAIF
jgi:hypothetical protein